MSGAAEPGDTAEPGGAAARHPAIVWSPAYEVDIGPHVFPTRKYRRVRERLVEEGLLAEDGHLEPTPAPSDDLARVHSEEYLRKVRGGSFDPMEELRLEVPFSPELRESMVLCCGGTTLAVRRALGAGAAVHLGGGFHHAFPDHGEGFCLLNDVAVAAGAVRAADEAARVAVVDLDVHHGNGTAAVFSAEPAVFTFSMHQEANYPALKPPGDLDVGLPDGTDDTAYLERLERHLPEVLDGFAPDVVLYLAGADPYREDRLGGLSLSGEGLRERDRTVLEGCRAREIPVAVTLAGGYAFREEDTVEIHVGTVRKTAALLG